jgi:hypothetical protein
MSDDTPRTVRVRIAVAVTPEGGWASFGTSTHTNGVRAAAFSRRLAGDYSHMRGHPQRITWVEADVPLPLPESTVEGAPCDE